jgi:hypothetical protein
LADLDSPVRPTVRRRRTFKQKWALISLPNKLMVIATIVIAFATVVNLLVAWKMWREMHNSGTDTHSLAEAAAKQAADTHTLAADTHTLASLEKEQFQVAQRPIVALTEETGSPRLAGLGQVLWEWRFSNTEKRPRNRFGFIRPLGLESRRSRKLWLKPPHRFHLGKPTEPPMFLLRESPLLNSARIFKLSNPMALRSEAASLTRMCTATNMKLDFVSPE